MAMSRTLLLTSLLCGAFAVESASAAPMVLVTLPFDSEYSLSSAGSPSDALTLQFAFSLAPGGLTDPDTLVFEQLPLTPSDAGSSFKLGSALVDPQLPAFLARLTNGVDDDLRHDAIGNNGGGIGLVAPESGRLVPRVSRRGPDLVGYEVTALELFIGELVIDPLAGSSLPHWQVRGELRFLGTPTPVPLPGALLPFALATVAVSALRRRAV